MALSYYTQPNQVVGITANGIQIHTANYSIVGDGTTPISSALNDLLQEVKSTGGGTTNEGVGTVLLPAGKYMLNSQVTIPSGIELRMLHGCLLSPTTNTDMVRVQLGARLVGGVINTSWGSGWDKTAIEVDGDYLTGISWWEAPTVINTQLRGPMSDNTYYGTAIYMHASELGNSIYKVDADCYISGYEYGVHMEVVGGEGSGGLEPAWINGNRFRIRGYATKHFIKQTITSGTPAHCDGNQFEIDYQTNMPHSSTVVEFQGRYNQIRGQLWDWSREDVPSVKLSNGAHRNLIMLSGVEESHVENSSTNNTLFLFGDYPPRLQMRAIEATDPTFYDKDPDGPWTHVAIDAGPNDSAGSGYRVLRVPNRS